MNTAEAIVLAWSLGIVQLIGLTSALGARLSSGTTAQVGYQRFFFACLALMGVVTMGSLYLLGPGYWLFSAATLSVMILIVTCDFGEIRAGQRPGL